MKRKFAHTPFSPGRFPMFYGWPIVAAGSLGMLMSVPGQTMGVSVFTDYLIEALNLTRNQLSTAYMLGTIGSACLLLWAGRLYDRLGARTMAVMASISLALVLLFLSQVDVVANYLTDLLNLPAAMVGFAVIVVGFLGLRFWGQGVLTLASQNMVAKWFVHRRGMAIGLTGFCVALGFSIAPLALDKLIRTFGWRGAWIALAALVGGIFALIAWVLYRDNPEDCGLLPDGHSEARRAAFAKTSVAEPCWTRSQAMRTGAFWVFAFSLALYGLYMTGLTFHIVSIFETSGMTRLQAVTIFLPTSIIAVLVHLSGGWLSDRIPLKRLLVTMLLGMALSTGGLAFLAPGWPIYILIVGSGLAGGLGGMLSGVTWARFFGRQHLGAISGLFMSISVLGSALGPILFSLSLAGSGSYRLAAIICFAAMACLLVATLLTRQPAHSPGPQIIQKTSANPDPAPVVVATAEVTTPTPNPSDDL